MNKNLFGAIYFGSISLATVGLMCGNPMIGLVPLAIARLACELEIDEV
jgi:hypothetical protein